MSVLWCKITDASFATTISISKIIVKAVQFFKQSIEKDALPVQPFERQTCYKLENMQFKISLQQ
jgi:hypothetical protein